MILGALEDGTKELVTIHDSHRKSKLSWYEVLQELKSRGLSQAPIVATGNGALGFWAALSEKFPLKNYRRSTI